MKSKVLILLAAALVAASLGGCTGKEDSSAITPPATAPESAASQQEESSESESESESEQEESGKEEESKEGENKDDESKEEESKEESGDESGDEEKSEGESSGDVSVDDILKAIAEAYGDEYPANADMPVEILEAQYGLTSDLYEEAKGQMAAISVNNDVVVVVKAKEGKGGDVEMALDAARKRKVEDTLQYPSNIPKTNAARVVRDGDYVAFLLVGRNNENVQDPLGEAEAQFAKDEVQKAVDAFEGVFRDQ